MQFVFILFLTVVNRRNVYCVDHPYIYVVIFYYGSSTSWVTQCHFNAFELVCRVLGPGHVQCAVHEGNRPFCLVRCTDLKLTSGQLVHDDDGDELSYTYCCQLHSCCCWMCDCWYILYNVSVCMWLSGLCLPGGRMGLTLPAQNGMTLSWILKRQ